MAEKPDIGDGPLEQAVHHTARQQVEQIARTVLSCTTATFGDVAMQTVGNGEIKAEGDMYTDFADTPEEALQRFLVKCWDMGNGKDTLIWRRSPELVKYPQGYIVNARLAWT